MKTVIEEKHIRVKLLWEVPDDFDTSAGADPSESDAKLISIGLTHLSPDIIRTLVDAESGMPATDQKTIEAADRGYWSRLVRAFRG